MQQVQRTGALDSMAAGVAHDGNTTTPVQDNLEQAGRNPSSERQARQLACVRWGAAQAARLTQRMLHFARWQPVSRPADLGELVCNMDTLLKQAVGIPVTLAVDALPGPLPVPLDASQLELALFNLDRNASDATPEGGALTICTRRLYRGRCQGVRGIWGGRHWRWHGARGGMAGGRVL